MAKDDLISKNDLLLSLAEYVNSNAYLNQTALDALLMVMRWVKEDPAVDAVEVVRCKDCKHCAVCGNGLHVCKAHDLHLLRTTPDGYCFRGERRESSDE